MSLEKYDTNYSAQYLNSALPIKKLFINALL